VRFDALPKRGSIPANFPAVMKRFRREDGGDDGDGGRGRSGTVDGGSGGVGSRGVGRRGDGSCAIVGNGGIILGTAASAAIESHDVVVRFNQAPP